MYKGDYMKNIEKYIFIFLVGGIGYGLIEIAFRGFTHWSMIITGGSALLILYLINQTLPETSLITKSLLGCVAITITEFTVGIVVNKMFSFGVWDYTDSPGNILGIITPVFSIFWFAISFVMIFIIMCIQKTINQQKS